MMTRIDSVLHDFIKFKANFTTNTFFFNTHFSSFQLGLGFGPQNTLFASLHSNTDYHQSMLQKVRNLDDALNLFDEMTQRHPLPSVNFTRLLALVTKMKHFSESLHLFKQICAIGVPNVVSYSTIIDDLTVSDVITYTCMINGLCKLGRWNEVLMMLKEMDDGRISLNVQTFNVLVDAFCKEGKVEEAEAVINIMVERGKLPNIVTCNSLIDGYCLRGEMIKARTILDSMVSRDIVPNNSRWSLQQPSNRGGSLCVSFGW